MEAVNGPSLDYNIIHTETLSIINVKSGAVAADSKGGGSKM